MSTVLGWLLDIVLQYRYLAVFGATLLSSIAIPLPAGALLMASAFLASTGFMNLALVMLAGAGGSIIGDNVLYWVARRYGLHAARRLGLGHFESTGWFRQLKDVIFEHPVSTVYLCQFSAGLGPPMNFLCGIAQLPYRRFLIYEVTGEVSMALVNGTLGFVFGDNWQALSDIFGHFATAVALVAFIFYLLLWRRIFRRHFQRHLRAATMESGGE